MKKFIRETLIILGLSLLIFICIKLLFTQFQQKNYNSAFVDKLKILKANKDKKKIVLIGGSSVGWGLSAEQIEKALGIRTINLGHHAGYGLTDFGQFISEQINPDDIIIFSPEWNFYINPGFTDKATLDDLIHQNLEYGKLTGNNLHRLKSFFLYDIRLLNPEYYTEKNPYIYRCINQNGDIISHCGLKPNGASDYELGDDDFDAAEFSKHFPYLKLAKTIIVFPPTQKRIYIKYKSRLDKLETDIRKHAYTVAGTVADNVYSENEFYDAAYHLSCDSRKKRTDSIIRLISGYVNDTVLVNNGR